MADAKPVRVRQRTVYRPDALWIAVRKKALDAGVSASDFVEHALIDYLARLKK